jgi:phenylacetate-CoA ligase
MRHAVVHVPFYRTLGIAADSLREASDLERFPVIRKLDVQRDPSAFLADGYDLSRCFASRTSGRSGEPTTTYFDGYSWLLTRYALKMRRVYATSGLPLFKRIIIVSEQPTDRLADLAKAAPPGLGLFFRTRYLSIHTPAERHLEDIAAFEPHAIYAFPSYLLELLESARANGTTLPRTPVLYTSSELLQPAARREIEQGFHGHVYDVYGSTEFKEVAWQCTAGRYHVNHESVYVEEAPAGQATPILLSTVCNRAMPLLRFSIGDNGMFAEAPCSCGRKGPTLHRFTGREGDVIQLPSGRRISPYLLTTFIEEHDAVKQYRIVQEDAHSLRLDVVLHDFAKMNGWQDTLASKLMHIISEPVEVRVRLVSRLERSASQKQSVFERLYSLTDDGPCMHQAVPAAQLDTP